MPIYDFECERCSHRHELRLPVDRREDTYSQCTECGGLTKRVFTPSANIFVHSHFRVLQSDFVPEKGDPAWEHLQTGSGSQTHAPKTETFQTYFDRTYKGCD